mmetsp:Transcript_4825/g.8288  ORF Transcript_4825/g.8288 Transcript_4825/m.8288 type:complete len:235 (-) Transcript_4825:512-1216(-)
MRGEEGAASGATLVARPTAAREIDLGGLGGTTYQHTHCSFWGMGREGGRGVGHVAGACATSTCRAAAPCRCRARGSRSLGRVRMGPAQAEGRTGRTAHPAGWSRGGCRRGHRGKRAAGRRTGRAHLGQRPGGSGQTACRRRCPYRGSRQGRTLACRADRGPLGPLRAGCARRRVGREACVVGGRSRLGADHRTGRDEGRAVTPARWWWWWRGLGWRWWYGCPRIPPCSAPAAFS